MSFTAIDNHVLTKKVLNDSDISSNYRNKPDGYRESFLERVNFAIEKAIEEALIDLKDDEHNLASGLNAIRLKAVDDLDYHVRPTNYFRDDVMKHGEFTDAEEKAVQSLINVFALEGFYPHKVEVDGVYGEIIPKKSEVSISYQNFITKSSLSKYLIIGGVLYATYYYAKKQKLI